MVECRVGEAEVTNYLLYFKVRTVLKIAEKRELRLERQRQ